MTTITDDFMQQMLAASKDYTIVILRVVPGKDQTEVKKNCLGAWAQEFCVARGWSFTNYLPGH
ncbi:MAG: hypothetical protein NVS2B12_28940 [Ktedonobacteraceae bacterium]